MKRYIFERLLAVCVGLCVAQASLFAAEPIAGPPAGPTAWTILEPTPEEQAELLLERTWRTLAKDDLHDPAGPGLRLLINPGAELFKLPPDTVGNKVRWVKALQEGHINPQPRLFSTTKLDEDVVEDIMLTKMDTGDLPRVLFPHKLHSEWLSCKDCHDRIFKTKAGETPITMLAILEGEYCGRCHGAVAFPLTKCMRCHSVPHETRPHLVKGAAVAPATKKSK
ncbi:MAG: cytochrome c3 family protein [Gallionella sp.]|nr:cytochrome c3 family protein [Gallionella sp.]